MKIYIVIILLIILFSYTETNAQNPSHQNSPKQTEEVNYPEIPRISAYEAYIKYKEGRVIIFHGGGEQYNKRHILGAFNLDVQDSMKDKILPRFPKEGMEIFVYCY